jgi:hypothetical protein
MIGRRVHKGGASLWWQPLMILPGPDCLIILDTNRINEYS